MHSEELTFDSDGFRLAARLYRPAKSDAPVIVMAHGFSAVMAQLDPQARHFAGAGFAVLGFDHPGFGLSDGAVRGEVDPARHLAAWRDAISLAGRIEGCDGTRIGLWGSSLSGGHVLQAGALDPRVSAVVSQVPFIDGWELLARRPDIDAFAVRLAAERAARGRGAPPTMLPVVSSDPEGLCALRGADAWSFFGAVPVQSWENSVAFSSYEHLRGYTPGAWIARMSAPLLMIVADDDQVTPTAHALAAFETARPGDRLVTVPGGHFDVYAGAGFETAMNEAAGWFTVHLGPGTAV